MGWGGAAAQVGQQLESSWSTRGLHLLVHPQHVAQRKCSKRALQSVVCALPGPARTWRLRNDLTAGLSVGPSTPQFQLKLSLVPSPTAAAAGTQLGRAWHPGGRDKEAQHAAASWAV